MEGESGAREPGDDDRFAVAREWDGTGGAGKNKQWLYEERTKAHTKREGGTSDHMERCERQRPHAGARVRAK